MSDNVQVTYRFKLKIPNCDKVFAEGFNPGEFVIQDVVFTVPDSQRNHPMFMAAVSDAGQKVLNENVEVIMEEVK